MTSIFRKNWQSIDGTLPSVLWLLYIPREEYLNSEMLPMAWIHLQACLFR